MECGRAPRGRGRSWRCVCRIIASSEGFEPAHVQILGFEVCHGMTDLGSLPDFGDGNKATNPPLSTALDFQGGVSNGASLSEGMREVRGPLRGTGPALARKLWRGSTFRAARDGRG